MSENIRVKFGRAGHGFVTVLKDDVAYKLIARGAVTKMPDQAGVNEPPALENMTRFELLAAAKDAGVTGVERYAKTGDLIAAIRKAREKAKPGDPKKSDGKRE